MFAEVSISNSIITKAESRPPERLMRNAVMPLIKNTKPDLRKTMVNADFRPKKKRQYIVTILDSPSFTPGGNIGVGGMRYSTYVSTNENANKRPIRAI
jgi:hypothetical protein